MKKRMISLLLALVMILGMLPAATLTAFAESGKVAESGNVIEWLEGSGTKDDPYLIKSVDQWRYVLGQSVGAFDGVYVKLVADLYAALGDMVGYGLEICVDAHVDMNGYSFYRVNDYYFTGILVEDENDVAEVTGHGSVPLVLARYGTIIINGPLIMTDSTRVIDGGTVILNHPELIAQKVSISGGGKLILKQGTVTDLYNTANGGNDHSFIMYGGRLEDTLAPFDTPKEYGLRLSFYGGEIAPSEVYQDRADYSETGEQVFVANTSYAFFSNGTARQIASFDDLVEAVMSHGKFTVYAPYFAEQSVSVSGGTADLGTIKAASYPITFKGNKLPTEAYTAGYRAYESLKVYNSNKKLVYECSNDTQNGEGLTYDLNRLPKGTYTIVEEVTFVDKNGQELLSEENKIVVNWTPTVVPSVIAKSTEPIAGTVNTAPTITIAPEFHCKISDYAEGYWLDYTKGLGWRRMEENTKFEADKDYAYSFAIETTDGYTFPADGGYVYGILQCDQSYFGAEVNRVEGRDDVAEMVLYYPPCTYGAPLEFSEQTPVADFTNNLYEMEGILGQEYLFRFNHKPLTDAQKAKGFSVERTLTVFEGSLSNVVYNVANDTGTQPLSYNLTIEQAQNYVVSMMITLKKDGTTLQTKGGVYLIRVVAGGTPVIFTADSSNSFGGTVTVDIDAMAKKDANLKTALDNGTVKYQWYRGASQIPGADGQSYTFHADDVGKKIKVAVLYGNSGSISEPFEVGGTAPAFTKQPTGGNVGPDKTMTVKWATNFTPTKIVVDKYNFVGLASEYTTLSGTATSTELPANEYGYVIKAYYNDNDFITSNKFTVNEVAFTNPFTDVKEGDFYYDPVMWAVENGITTGATATTFNPGGNCLRAHVVTFLHRAAGNPEPTKTNNPFTDVKTSDFFYKPVLWAVEKKITNGTSATTFGSYDNCNRAAVVTFLWRNAGSPEPKSTKNPFVDVKSTDFFYKPVLWAVEQGITNGLDATHFGPATACNRAQVVTFLYRAYN